MKRTMLFATVLLASFVAHAQGDARDYPIIDKDVVRELLSTTAVLLVIIFISSFILAVMRLTLDNRLKNKLIDKGVSEDLVSQFLQPVPKENKYAIVKWFTILAGIGVGLSLIDAFQPLGIHSLAIMAFSLAASFLGYYMFTRKSEK